jgi:hypothetical protein
MVFKNKKFKIVTVLIIIIFVIFFLSIMMQHKPFSINLNNNLLGTMFWELKTTGHGVTLPSSYEFFENKVCKPCPSMELDYISNTELSDSSQTLDYISNTELSDSSQTLDYISNSELSDSSQTLDYISNTELSDSSQTLDYISNSQIPCSGLKFFNPF